MSDYFHLDADVVFMDLTYLIKYHLDEGILLMQLFQIIRRCSPGTFIILISLETALEVQDYGSPPLMELFQSSISETSSATVYLYKMVIAK